MANISLARTRFRLRLVRPLLVAAVAAGAPHLALAQTCEPPDDSNEAGIFAIRSLSLAAGRVLVAPHDAAGSIRLGVEASLLPRISDAKATPTACRPGKGPENVNALPAFARLRVTATLPRHLQLEASWLPPVSLEGMRGQMFGVALGYRHVLGSTLAVVARAHAALGSISGPFTCADDDVTDDSSECFGGERSRDRFQPNITGVDLSADWAPTGVVSAHAGAGYTRLAPRFRVHFRNAAGELDSTLVRAELDRLALFGGATRSIGRHWRVGAEVYATPQDGATLRVALDAAVRRPVRE